MGSEYLYPSRWEKRNVAYEVPAWDPNICIQCNKCSLVCPHAAIRTTFYDAGELKNAPATFKSADFRSPKYAGSQFTVQVAPEDCTGCGLCVENCPARDRKNPDHKALGMVSHAEVVENEKENFEFFCRLPNPPADALTPDVKGSQFRLPLFEFSGACAGCGETPYIKLLTQLFGDHLLLANATGCSSIYGGNLPTTPYCTNEWGRGPAWANSLFEDNAEFGMGMLLAQEQRLIAAQRLLGENSENLGESFVQELLQADQSSQMGIEKQRERVVILRERLADSTSPSALLLRDVADSLVKKSVWIVGGDGWAYDIGFGGLDHVLASGKNVKVLVLDTEVYSNTGGQQSKSTPRGAIAKFAASGKSGAKKNLGRIAMTYGHVYVAQVAMGARDSQTVSAFLEAEAYDGPALIVAYSPCIAHGYELRDQLQHQKLAVESGYWNLYRYDPRRQAIGKNPLLLDSRAPTAEITTFMETENRFSLLKRTHPERAKQLAREAQSDAVGRHHGYVDDAGRDASAP